MPDTTLTLRPRLSPALSSKSSLATQQTSTNLAAESSKENNGSTSLPSPAIRVGNLPQDVTIKQLYRWFSIHGDIMNIEVYPRRNGETTNSGIVTFRNPIYSPFWSNGALCVPHPDLLSYPDGLDISVTMAGGRANTRQQGQRAHASAVNFKVERLDFGSMPRKDELVVVNSISSTHTNNITLELLPLSREVVVQFPFPTKDSGRSDLRDFKWIAPLNNIAARYQVNDNGDPTSLIISLPHPPRYLWRSDASIYSIPDDARRWSPWQRATDVCDVMTTPGQHPIGTYVMYRNAKSIDVGRLTTFRLILSEDVDKNLAELMDMKNALQDFNINTEICHELKVRRDSSDMWDHLDHAQQGETGDSLSLLSMDQRFDRVDLDFKVRYLLEVCVARKFLNEYSIGYEFLNRLSSLTVSEAQARLNHLIDKDLRLEAPLDLFTESMLLPKSELLAPPHYCTLVHKAHVTPTGLKLNPPNVELSNRVMRKYHHIADHFLRVQFLDDREMSHMAKIRDGKNEIWKRLQRVFDHGIRIGDRLYEFLGFGSSQLKEGSVLFFFPTAHTSCDDVRNWMGDFAHIKSIAKYGARLGQCLSTTRAVRGIPAPKSQYIEDIEKEGFCFTDGVGKISSFLSQLIIQDMGLTVLHEPSAIQFRMGGCKGVLAVWPTAKGTEVHIRKSQEKFKAKFNNLEIIRCSRYCTATLNRQTIVILECLGVPVKSFMKLLNAQIEQYESAMRNNLAAIRLLTKFVDENQSTLFLAELLNAGFRSATVREPFVVNLLTLWRSWSLKLLKEKARIHIEKSAFVLGCVDETGTLRGHDSSTEGTNNKDKNKLPQIFLQFNDPKYDKKKFIVQGICIVGRNPSLHPGDIRVVEAVDVPALHHLKDVVVFPSTGDRPLPSMLSGGDLDGDDYFVIWDDRLMPEEWNYPPMDYTPPAPVEIDRSVTVNDLKDFAIQYMKNDVLGLVATSHLGWADDEQDGPKSARCLHLAQLHSQAVDYQKTGVPAAWHESMQPRRWPHYMGKNSSYITRKALGKVYDRVCRSNVEFSPEQPAAFDQRILQKYELNDEILSAARHIKLLYDLSVKRLMAQRHVNTEYELFTGWAMSSPVVGTDYKRQEDLGQDLEALKTRFREMCYKKAGGEDGEKIDRFVAAMYTVTAEQALLALNNDGQADIDLGYDGPPLISFPWIFDWVMVRLVVDKKYKPLRSTLRATKWAGKPHSK